MRQEPVVFENEGQKLFGTVHVPDPPHLPPFPALVMLHGFTGNRIEAHQLFVKAARRFAAAGILVLRFDFRCCGESEGEFRDLTVRGEISDAVKALGLVRGRGDVDASRVGLLGLSLGGAVAACVAGKPTHAPRCLVLWAAVADLPRAFGGKIAGKIAPDPGQRRVHDHFGNALSRALLDELRGFAPLASLGGWAGPALVVHGDADAGVSPDDALLYEEALSGRGFVELRMIRGSGHTFAGLAWEREVIETTARFLESRL